MALIGLLGRRDPGRGRTWFQKTSTSMREGSYRGHVTTGGMKLEILGTAVAREGVLLVAPRLIPEPEFSLDFTLRERLIRSRVKTERTEPLDHKGKVVHRYACSFTAISADDWDAVVRYVSDSADPTAVEKVAVTDEAFRTLPSEVQNRIVALLVREKKLAPPAAGTAPLIRVRLGALRDLGNDRTAQDIFIHSRVVTNDASRSFESAFRIFSDNRVEPLPSGRSSPA